MSFCWNFANVKTKIKCGTWRYYCSLFVHLFFCRREPYTGSSEHWNIVFVLSVVIDIVLFRWISIQFLESHSFSVLLSVAKNCFLLLPPPSIRLDTVRRLRVCVCVIRWYCYYFNPDKFEERYVSSYIATISKHLLFGFELKARWSLRFRCESSIFFSNFFCVSFFNKFCDTKNDKTVELNWNVLTSSFEPVWKVLWNAKQNIWRCQQIKMSECEIRFHSRHMHFMQLNEMELYRFERIFPFFSTI